MATGTAGTVRLAAADTSSEGPKCPSARVLHGLGALAKPGAKRQTQAGVAGWPDFDPGLVEEPGLIEPHPGAIRVGHLCDGAERGIPIRLAFCSGLHAPAKSAQEEVRRVLRTFTTAPNTTRQLAEKIGGTAGRLIAALPEAARARTDPFDDGRFERWQDSRFTFRALNNIDAFGASGIYERMFIYARAPTS